MPKPERITAGTPHTRYRLDDGTLVPGVTTVLQVLAKPGLVPWANALGLKGIDTRTYVDGLARIGTLAHGLIEQHMGGPAVDPAQWTAEEMDRAENALLHYFDWWDRYHPVATLIEQPLVHAGWRYGGTIDFLCRIDRRAVLVDVKTAKALYPEHIIQVAAYHRLLVHHGHQVDEVRILRVGRTEDEAFEERVLAPAALVPYWRLFRHALAIYRLQQDLRGA